MTPVDIIAKIGRRDLAEATGAKQNAITQWRKWGIPPKFWHKIVLLPDAREKGITFELLETVSQSTPRRQRNP